MNSVEHTYEHFPEECPYCGDRHEVYVANGDELVDVMPVDGNFTGDEYPVADGYQYYYKQCPQSKAREVRVVAEETGN
jgi:hypothetical protein